MEDMNIEKVEIHSLGRILSATLYIAIIYNNKIFVNLSIKPIHITILFNKNNIGYMMIWVEKVKQIKRYILFYQLLAFASVVTLYAKNTSQLEYYPSSQWEIREAVGYSPEKLKKAEKYFDNSGATAVMVIQDGYIIAEWGDTLRRANCYSVRKSFLSALYGIYTNKGKIDISKSLLELGIDDKKKLTSTEKKAKISDLLKARSGVYHPAAYETKGMKKRRPRRGSHFPGTFYYYNNWDFNTLGTIFEQETKETIFKAFKKNIADPIGMNFKISDGKYVKSKVSKHAAYPFWMSARDRARFGLLYLRNGKWKNKQIIPTSWIAESITPYSQVQKGVGYGYMWWVSTGKWHLGNKIKGKAYSARGYWGQYIVILPDYNLVVVQVSDKSLGAKNVKGKSFNKLLKLILAAKK